MTHDAGSIAPKEAYYWSCIYCGSSPVLYLTRGDADAALKKHAGDYHHIPDPRVEWDTDVKDESLLSPRRGTKQSAGTETK